MPDPRPDDLAAVRAEMRRMLDAWHRGVDVGLVDYLTRHADALLADPAPEGLTEDERLVVEEAREAFPPGDDPVSWPIYLSQRLLAIIDRLSAPETGEGGENG